MSCNFPIIEASFNRNDRGTQKSRDRLLTESDALDKMLSPQELQGKKSELLSKVDSRLSKNNLPGQYQSIPSTRP